jgi:iron complex outermembrane recepter protein
MRKTKPVFFALLVLFVAIPSMLVFFKKFFRACRGIGRFVGHVSNRLTFPHRRRVNSTPESSAMRGLIAVCCLVSIVNDTAVTAAEASARRIYNLPANDVANALKLFSEQSGRGVIAGTDLVKGIRTNPVSGELTAAEALQRMLAGTGLIGVEDRQSGTFAIRKETGAEKNGGKAAPKTAADQPAPRDTTSNSKASTPDHAMTTSKRPPAVKRVLTAIAALFLGTAPTLAQSETTGSLEGRVQNSTTGDYLNNARVTIGGTTLTTLTNEFGEYQLRGVPVGEAKVSAFYSGLPAQTATVTIAPGQRAMKDFELQSGARKNELVQLSAYTVSESRSMTDAAIATNEQRFAPNMKSVLSTDEFGEQLENNVGEFLKLMPAMSVEYVDTDVRNASIRGMPAHTTIVTANGNQLASAASTSASRVFEFEQISINEIARVEVNKSLVPDMPAEGIGGTINLITKSAFERSRPDLRYRVYLNANTQDLHLGKTPGPNHRPTHKIKPGFDFTYINPITKSLGFTVSGASSQKTQLGVPITNTWNLNRNAAGAENPVLESIFLNGDGTGKPTNRYSGRVSVDWRFARHDVLSVGFSEQFYEAVIVARRWNVGTGATPSAGTAAFTQGRPGAGSASQSSSTNHKSGTTWTPEFKYTHNGPVWKFEAGGAYSHASNHYRGPDRGDDFSNVTFNIGSFNAAGTFVGPTIRFDNTGNYVPVVTGVLADGRTVDTQDLNNTVLTTANNLFRKSFDTKKTLRLNGQRVVNFGVPIVVKAGGDIRQAIRDLRQYTTNYTFVGPDGRPNSPDNSAALYDLVAENVSTATPPFGLARFRRFDSAKAWNLYLGHPTWWTTDPDATYRDLVNQSRFVDETITSGFIRLDGSFFRNRLSLAGGVRFQHYKIRAEAGEIDTLGQYLHDEEGNLVLNPATGAPIRLSGSATEITRNTNIERGVKTGSTVHGYYPSLNASYRLTEDIQVRASYGKSVNYPQLSEVSGVTTVTDLTASPRRVTANKPLGPWTADNYDIDIEYYTRTGGAVTLAFFRKDISNFISQARYFPGTPEAIDSLTRLGYRELIPLNYEVVEKYNEGEASLQGWEFAVKQKLDAYVPSWARGITVFGNTSYKAPPKGLRAGDLSAQSTRVMNWGGSFQRGRLSTNLKWNHAPEPKLKVFNVNATHNFSRTYVDLDVAWRFSRAMSFFASGTNITAQPIETYIYSEATPDYARRRIHQWNGIQFVVGLKYQK